jgi:PAS domain S-box-containing protein
MSDDHTSIEALRAQLEAERAARIEAEKRIEVIMRLLAQAPGILIEQTPIPDAPLGSTMKMSGADVEAMFGYTREEILAYPGNFWQEHVHPEDAARTMEEGASVAVNGWANMSAHRILKKDGSVIWTEAYFRYEPGAPGEPGRSYALAIDVSRRVQSEQESRRLLQQEQILRQRLDGLVSSLPGMLWEAWFEEDPAQQRSNYVSEMCVPMTGYTSEEWERPNFWLDIVHPADRERAEAESRLAVATGSGTSIYRYVRKDGRALWVNTRMTVIRDEAGVPVGLRGVTTDINELKEAEAAQEEARVREEVLRAQAEGLLELSTPLVPIDDELLAMPLVGAMDPRRGERVLHALLTGVARAGAKAVILDVTGVPEVDEQAADTLLRAARAVELLGAEVILTGIGPDVAQTLVALDTDMRRVTTRGTLKAGIAYVTGKRRKGR